MFCIFKIITVFIVFAVLHIDEAYLTNNFNLDDIVHNNLSCQIPYNSFHYTKYETFNEVKATNRILKSGEYLPNFSKIRTVCNKNYKLEPFKVDFSVCLNDEWSPLPTICLRACPRLISTTSTNVVCEYKGSILENCNNPVEGTTANLTCNPFYTGNGLSLSSIHSCTKGRWNAPILSQCKPVCGHKRSRGISNIVHGSTTASGDYPWHVGIYNADKNLICGGTIIERNIVLSAAQCVAEYNGTTLPKEDFWVGAGKYYSGYDDSRDSEAQFSSVSKIFIPERYKGTFSSYAYDISVLILTNPFTLCLSVQPVCIELNNDVVDVYDGIDGTVTGWGFTEKGQEFSKVLRELVVPYIPINKCHNASSNIFKRYLMNDKFCGGYVNNSMAICNGDNGEALVIKHSRSDLYFIKGIVSLFPSVKQMTQCDSNQYGLYTSVKFHKEYVKGIVYNNRLNEPVESPQDIESKEFITKRIYGDDLGSDFLKNNFASCTLPDYPPHGKYTVENQNNTYRARDYVQKDARLYLTCDADYTFTPPYSNQYICSENGQWMPSPANCSRVCPKLTSTVSTNIKCEYNGQSLVNCENPVEGTRALLSCNQFYENSIIQKNPILECSEGKWNSSTLQCSPICGNPTTPNDEYHSWHVGIYNTKKEFLCGGSIIINTQIILSAAECFVDYANKIQSAENFLVAAGKFYREYDDYRDKGAQYSTILEIHIHEEYKGRINFNTYNIAILILRNPLLMSTVVQPVCLQLNESSKDFDIALFNNGLGELRGWGFTRETGRLSDVLKRIEILYIPINKCNLMVPIRFRRHVNFDKICGAYTTNNGSSFCGRDGGGGLVFRSNVGRYYIKGIASDSSSTDMYPCHLGIYTVYTSLAYHTNFLKKILANYL